MWYKWWNTSDDVNIGVGCDDCDTTGGCDILITTGGCGVCSKNVDCVTTGVCSKNADCGALDDNDGNNGNDGKNLLAIDVYLGGKGDPGGEGDCRESKNSSSSFSRKDIDP